jgi:CrcB protein
MTVLAIVAAGAFGSLARWRLDTFVASRIRSPFPLGTLCINVTGSLVLGALTGAVLAGHLSQTTLAWAGTGFLGGYTTFSTFTFETLRLIEDAAWRQAGMNLLLSGPLSFALAALGYVLTSR